MYGMFCPMCGMYRISDAQHVPYLCCAACTASSRFSMYRMFCPMCSMYRISDVQHVRNVMSDVQNVPYLRGALCNVCTVRRAASITSQIRSLYIMFHPIRIMYRLHSPIVTCSVLPMCSVYLMYRYVLFDVQHVLNLRCAVDNSRVSDAQCVRYVLSEVQHVTYLRCAYVLYFRCAVCAVLSV